MASAGQALTALRVAGSVAVSGPVAQTTVDASTPARDGQLRLRHGLLRHKTTVISSGLTAVALTRRLEQMRTGRASDADTELANALGRAIAVFTSARYSRTGSLSTDALTRELDSGIAQLKRQRWLALRHRPPRGDR